MSAPRHGEAHRDRLRRAHQSLWTLLVVMILASGVLSATITAPPSPLMGITFALTSAVFAIAFLLAARITVALESARGTGRASVRVADSLPALSRLVARRRKG